MNSDGGSGGGSDSGSGILSDFFFFEHIKKNHKIANLLGLGLSGYKKHS